ncbi:MAG: transporter associated domain-containing protein [Roseimicrobium sp.]
MSLLSLSIACAFAVLLLLAASLSALETALHALREKGSSRLPEKALGNSQLQDCLRDPLSVLPELLGLAYALDLLLGACGAWLVVQVLCAQGWGAWAGAATGLGVIFFAVSLVPYVGALWAPWTAVRCTLPVFLALRALLGPVTRRFQSYAEKWVTRLTPRKLKPREKMLADEVETLIDMREEQGDISSDEAALLHGIVAWHGMIVKDVMTPRVDLPLMPHDARDDDAQRMLEGARHRFVAVFDEKTDSVAWLIDVRKWRALGRPHWSSLTATPSFVPETLALLDAWDQYLLDEASVVVALDEYGGFEGLLSRDCVTSYLLAKAAPTPHASLGIQALGRNRYLVAGNTRLVEIEHELEITLEAEGVDTIGGLVMNHFGYPPKPGESLTLGELDIKVRRTSHARVQQLELHLRGETEGGDA